MPLEGKVAQLPDQRTAVINIGSNDGVAETDVYEIYELGDPVIDPDTGEEIGSIRYTKATVIPETIMEEMTIVENQETTTTGPMSNIGLITGTTTRRKKLSRKDDLKSDKDEVKVGDLVVRIDEDEEETEQPDDG